MESDMFTFKMVPKDVLHTKRILSVTSSIYYPLAIISPITLLAKKLLQDLCKQGLTSDEEIMGEKSQFWRRWLSNLPMLSSVALPICLKAIDWPGTKCRASPICRCPSDCSWDCVICKTLQWKWPYPLQFPRREISRSSRETDDYTQIGIVSLCFSCQNESDVTRRISVKSWLDSYLVRLHSCPPIYQEQRDKRFYMFVPNYLAVIHDGSEPSQ